MPPLLFLIQWKPIKMSNIVLGQKEEDLLENVSIFDVYIGKEISEGTKSLGLSFFLSCSCSNVN